MKRRIAAVLLAVLTVLSLAACGGKKTETTAAAPAAQTTAAPAAQTTAAPAAPAAETTAAPAAEAQSWSVKIGASITPHAEILNFAKSALAAKGLEIEVVEFTDYVLPNTAVEEGDLDANYFQHTPYMDSFNEEKGTHLVSAGIVHYEPFGMFAGKKSALSEVADGDQIAVPNDTTNEARALLLLEAQGLLKLKDGAGLTATKQDIVENPHNLDIIEMEAAQISRTLASVAYAVMNGNYAIQAGISISDALAIEDAASVGAQTYGNVIAVKEGRENEPWVPVLLEVLHSDEVKKYIADTYAGAVVALD